MSCVLLFNAKGAACQVAVGSGAVLRLLAAGRPLVVSSEFGAGGRCVWGFGRFMEDKAMARATPPEVTPRALVLLESQGLVCFLPAVGRVDGSEGSGVRITAAGADLAAGVVPAGWRLAAGYEAVFEAEFRPAACGPWLVAVALDRSTGAVTVGGVDDDGQLVDGRPAGFVSKAGAWPAFLVGLAVAEALRERGGGDLSRVSSNRSKRSKAAGSKASKPPGPGSGGALSAGAPKAAGSKRPASKVSKPAGEVLDTGGQVAGAIGQRCGRCGNVSRHSEGGREYCSTCGGERV